jgi:hypothetical protein
MRHALAQAHGAQHLGRAVHAVLPGIAANAQRHGHVLLGRELGQQVVELVDEAQMPVAQRALLLRAELVQGWPMRLTLPVVGASSPPSKCSKVDLPEPEAPTIASVSPA